VPTATLPSNGHFFWLSIIIGAQKQEIISQASFYFSELKNAEQFIGGKKRERIYKQGCN
jgi:hypothetical protein